MPENAPLSMLVIVEGNVISVNLWLLKNASTPIVSTPSEIVTFLTALSPKYGIYLRLAGKVISTLQFLKTALPNNVRLLGKTILSSASQLPNALYSIFVIESGKESSVNDVQSANADCSIVVTESGILIFFNLLNPLNAKNPIVWIPFFNVIDSTGTGSESSQSVISGISFKVDGNVIFFKETQSLNIPFPISVTPSGIDMLFNDLQFWKVQFFILVNEAGNSIVSTLLKFLNNSYPKAVIPSSTTIYLTFDFIISLSSESAHHKLS